MTAYQFHFFVRVGCETVEHNYDALTERTYVGYVAVEIFKTVAQTIEVGQLYFVQLNAAVHLKSLCGGYDYGKVGLQSRLTAQDVIEFLCTQVGTESGFRNRVFAVAQSHLRCQKRVTSVGNVGKRTTVYESGSVFGGLYQVGLYGILKQNHYGTCNAEVLNSERSAVVSVTQQNVLYTSAQVVLVGCKT